MTKIDGGPNGPEDNIPNKNKEKSPKELEKNKQERLKGLDKERRGDKESSPEIVQITLEKLEEDKEKLDQAFDAVGSELAQFEHWNDEEKILVSDILAENHHNYSEYEAVIQSTIDQGNAIAKNEIEGLSSESINSIVDSHNEIITQLDGYKNKLQNISQTLAKLKETLPDSSVQENSKEEYKRVLKNYSYAVNDFILDGVESLHIKEKPQNEKEKLNNEHLNFIYDSFSDNKDEEGESKASELSDSFVDVEHKLRVIKTESKKNDIDLKDFSETMSENSIKISPEMKEVFAMKNYFEMHPGLQKKIDKEIKILEIVKNKLMEEVQGDYDKDTINKKISNPDYYNASHLRQLVKDKILNNVNSGELLELLKEKKEVLIDFKSEVMAYKLGKKFNEEEVEVEEAENLEDEVSEVEESELVSGEKEVKNLEDGPIPKTESIEALDDMEEISAEEYEEHFWEGAKDLESDYQGYIEELEDLTTKVEGSVGEKFKKYIDSFKDYVSGYIKDKYDSSSNEAIKSHLINYIDQNKKGFKKFVDNLKAEGALQGEGQEGKETENLETQTLVNEKITKDKTEPTKPRETLLDDSEIPPKPDLVGKTEKTKEVTEMAPAEKLNEFWDNNEKLEEDIEVLIDKNLEEIQAQAGDQSVEDLLGKDIDDLEENIFDNITEYITNNYGQADDKAIADWIQKYIKTRFENTKNLISDAQEDLPEEVIELDESDLVELSSEEAAEVFWGGHEGIQSKFNDTLDKINAIRSSLISDGLIESSQLDDWQSVVTERVDDYLKKYGNEQSDKELETWVKGYLSSTLEDAQRFNELLRDGKISGEDFSGIISGEKEIEDLDYNVDMPKDSIEIGKQLSPRDREGVEDIKARDRVATTDVEKDFFKRGEDLENPESDMDEVLDPEEMESYVMKAEQFAKLYEAQLSKVNSEIALIEARIQEIQNANVDVGELDKNEAYLKEHGERSAELTNLYERLRQLDIKKNRLENLSLKYKSDFELYQAKKELDKLSKDENIIFTEEEKNELQNMGIDLGDSFEMVEEEEEDAIGALNKAIASVKAKQTKEPVVSTDEADFIRKKESSDLGELGEVVPAEESLQEEETLEEIKPLKIREITNSLKERIKLRDLAKELNLDVGQGLLSIYKDLKNLKEVGVLNDFIESIADEDAEDLVDRSFSYTTKTGNTVNIRADKLKKLYEFSKEF